MGGVVVAVDAVVQGDVADEFAIVGNFLMPRMEVF
jgi:hypothetical protein